MATTKGDQITMPNKINASEKSSSNKPADSNKVAGAPAIIHKRALLLSTLIFAIVAVVIRYKLSTKVYDHVNETLKSMLSIESRVSINKDLNVAVGFGSCLDIFVSSKDLIFENYQPPQNQIYHESIHTQDELNEVLAYFFAEGAAAERYIDNQTLFHELVRRAESIEGSRKAIGGNAAVMAKRFILEGLNKVVLGTQQSKLTSDQYTDGLVISGPVVDRDDVHICLEYPAGEKWGNFVAPRANRLIIHSDSFNPSLKSVDKFIEKLKQFKDLDLLVIGGLQMMDNIPIPIEIRREKLIKLNRVLAFIPEGAKTKVHLELASFTEEALLESIKDLVIPHVNSMGMNEQELPTLLNYLSNGKVDVRQEAYPRVATTLDQMRQLYQLLQKSTGRKLTRIHAHTLAFQAIMIRYDSGWKNTLTSSVKAALTAHRYTCGSHEIDMARAKLIMDESFTTSKHGSRRKIPFNSKHPVVCWQEDISTDIPSNSGSTSDRVTDTIEICVAPVLVCTKVKQTGGAGDNVSAAGLIFQL